MVFFSKVFAGGHISTVYFFTTFWKRPFWSKHNFFARGFIILHLKMITFLDRGGVCTLSGSKKILFATTYLVHRHSTRLTSTKMRGFGHFWKIANLWIKSVPENIFYFQPSRRFRHRMCVSMSALTSIQVSLNIVKSRQDCEILRVCKNTFCSITLLIPISICIYILKKLRTLVVDMVKRVIYVYSS